YTDVARKTVQAVSPTCEIQISESDFFVLEWPQILELLPEPLLIIGNPPWVTNSTLGSFKGSNLPLKSNLSGHRGIEALTGKSNFDISEWMLIRLLEGLRGKKAVLAMLCKAAVARKVLRYAWTKGMSIENSDIYYNPSCHLEREE
ncbi:MAG: SAM-dependent DNA methyltransferase, partial [Acidobacteriota bacterium]